MEDNTGWVLVVLIAALLVGWIAFTATGCMEEENLKLKPALAACEQQLIGCQGTHR